MQALQILVLTFALSAIIPAPTLSVPVSGSPHICTQREVAPRQYEVVCDFLDPSHGLISREDILWLAAGGGGGRQSVDVMLPRYLLRQSVTGALKGSTISGENQISIKLPAPLVEVTAQKQEEGVNIVSRPIVHLKYENAPPHLTVHYPNDAQYRAGSGPIQEPFSVSRSTEPEPVSIAVVAQESISKSNTILAPPAADEFLEEVDPEDEIQLIPEAAIVAPEIEPRPIVSKSKSVRMQMSHSYSVGKNEIAPQPESPPKEILIPTTPQPLPVQLLPEPDSDNEDDPDPLQLTPEQQHLITSNLDGFLKKVKELGGDNVVVKFLPSEGVLGDEPSTDDLNIDLGDKSFDPEQLVLKFRRWPSPR